MASRAVLAPAHEHHDHDRRDQGHRDHRAHLHPAGRGGPDTRRVRAGGGFVRHLSQFYETVCRCQPILPTNGDVPYTWAVPKLWTDTIEAHRRSVRDAILLTAATLAARHGLR